VRPRLIPSFVEQLLATMVGADRAMLICRIPEPVDDGRLHCGNLDSALDVLRSG